jgi:glycosyltransferase involved in cell wall biosynthesis
VFVRAIPRRPGTVRVYTPHGGSLHYAGKSAKGALYGRLERALMGRTDLFLFESAFARDTYQRMIGMPESIVRCVFNGVTSDEFAPLVPDADATDLAYVGEFRHIKGADILIDAVARLHAQGRPVTLTLGGDGEEMPKLIAQVERLNLRRAVRFLGHVRPRDGFAKGRLLVVPSRGDSMPYVVIEAAAAGVPMIAAEIGGIPEIFGPYRDALFAPSDAGALAAVIATALAAPARVAARAQALRERVFETFSQKAMVEGVLAAYGEAFTKADLIYQT